MGSTLDKVSGRAKEAAGILLDDDELARDGRVDQAAAEAKEKVEEAVDAIRDRIQRTHPR